MTPTQAENIMDCVVAGKVSQWHINTMARECIHAVLADADNDKLSDSVVLKELRALEEAVRHDK